LVNVLRDASGQRRGALTALNSDVAVAVSQGLTLEGMLGLCTDSFVRNLNAVSACIWIATPDRQHLVCKPASGTDLLQRLGIISDLRRPPRRVYEAAG